ncbi:MAG: glycosyltransferase family 4 protein [Candidatus Zixiibacteriota bacterium]|nr:MAG: glycosyltransferase family 4 protein [candidate division Zixibacteria bacterium]
MFKIGIDCRKISDGGIGTYLKNLLRCWKKQKVAADFYLFCHSSDLSQFDDYKNFAEIIIHDYPKYSVSELFSFRKPLRKYNIDVFFSPHYTLPFALPCPSVVTIHDLIHLRMPVKGGFFGRAYAGFIINNACGKSRVIITDSEFTRNDIADLFPKYSGRVEAIHIGVDRSVFKPLPEEDIESFKKRNSLKEEFILYVGTLKSHKNPEALAVAVNELDLPLVALTNDQIGFEKKLLSKANDKNLIRLIRLDSERDIALLYNSATLLFHPSLYEGFGLPPLEAMSCGLPVVCSNITSLPEVVGDAAVTFSPEDHDEMLGALKTVWDNREIRIKLSARGLERSKKFGWDYTAGRTFEILRGAAAG